MSIPVDSFLDEDLGSPLHLPNELWADPWLSLEPNTPTLTMPPMQTMFDAVADSYDSTPVSIGYLSDHGPLVHIPTAVASLQNLVTSIDPGNISITTEPMNSVRPVEVRPPVDHTKYKTRLCRNWTETGDCPYGEACVYAHGPRELRCRQHNDAAVYSLSKIVDQASRMRISSGPSTPVARGAAGSRPTPRRPAYGPIPAAGVPHMLRVLQQMTYSPDQCPQAAPRPVAFGTKNSHQDPSFFEGVPLTAATPH